MGNFTYKDIYIEDGNKVLEINVLPEKYCNFDCIFCPIGRSNHKTDQPISFKDFQKSMSELETRINHLKPDLIFINSKGEAFVNDKLTEIIEFIKGKGLRVRLLSNGYLLGQEPNKEIANMCDEVIGEIKIIKDEDFQKIQRPMDGYTLEEYILNMSSFVKQYKGKFIFEITIVKGYNDDFTSVQQLKRIIKLLSPSEVQVVRIDDEPFKKKLGISDERLEEITKMLLEK
ncbi:radical SAM protein [Marinisporobacter balticus]|uniref:Wyosine [tRNA(Phe)-imidazoG37] synthetase (Radical SAM superfamily) n=1 Tax=Marinisporobacter balticus TaxID=2018667 RepID=A0A4R2K973_9FIRM|nr:radical SAM protein [Marinisporobacter balticus]TCO69244.1 wyosine [tRNA(Phe)-imidazoG37] synthetase (radical SAM superfamily) [Marinisporobacter balticus]